MLQSFKTCCSTGKRTFCKRQSRLHRSGISKGEGSLSVFRVQYNEAISGCTARSLKPGSKISSIKIKKVRGTHSDPLDDMQDASLFAEVPHCTRIPWDSLTQLRCTLAAICCSKWSLILRTILLPAFSKVSPTEPIACSISRPWHDLSG